jgi:hypothetical protein
MSTFTLESAFEIASLSFRSKKRKSETKPLDGKEVLLFEALKRAERAHEHEVAEGKTELESHRRDLNMFAEHEKFYGFFNEAMTLWRDMEEPIKEKLVHFTQNHLQTIEGSHDTIELDRLRKRCDDTLEAIALAAHQEAACLRGRKGGVSQSVGDANKSLRPLLAFGNELKVFWKANVTQDRFGNQFDEEKPLSAASKLLFESAKLLQVKYKPGNIKTVMRMLTSRKPKSFPADEYMITFKSLPGF